MACSWCFIGAASSLHAILSVCLAILPMALKGMGGVTSGMGPCYKWGGKGEGEERKPFSLDVYIGLECFPGTNAINPPDQIKLWLFFFFFSME